MKTMYKAMSGSPETTLASGISTQDTVIELLTADNLPPAPNLVTIGTESDAEVVCYGSVSGTSLVDCVRGFGGTVAKSWPSETVVARCFTAYDHDTFVDNITQLDTDKIPTTDKGAANGVPTLDDTTKIPKAQLPQLSAADVGARPDSWTPTAEDVGARPSSWMPTAEDVHARPETWTPTAGDVGARPDSWTPTAEDVKAIPATEKGSAGGVVKLSAPGTEGQIAVFQADGSIGGVTLINAAEVAM